MEIKELNYPHLKWLTLFQETQNESIFHVFFNL